jgi:ABC-type Zn uptake system ZnuABC Zn-binding protein ZnuA
LAAALALLVGPASRSHAASAPLSVLTTTTDLADIVRHIGGDQVRVNSLCRGPEDPHFLAARPSFIRLGHQADLLVVVGMELEVGYLPLILRNGANARIRPGSAGYLDASARIRKLEVPEGGQVSRRMGDVHPLGNPHYMMDPANAVIVGDEVAKALSRLRPAASSVFSANAKHLRAQVSDLLLGKQGPGGRRTGGLLARFKPYRGAPIVAYHRDMLYLAQRLGLTVLGNLEPKPGVPPTAEHLRQLATQAKAAGVKAVLHEVFQPEAPVRSFAAQTNATPVLMAHQPHATADAPDLLSMYRRNGEALLRALSSGAR